MTTKYFISDGAFKLMESGQQDKVLTAGFWPGVGRNGQPTLEAEPAAWDYILMALFLAGSSSNPDAGSYQSIYDGVVSMLGVFRTCKKCGKETATFKCGGCTE